MDRAIANMRLPSAKEVVLGVFAGFRPAKTPKTYSLVGFSFKNRDDAIDLEKWIHGLLKKRNVVARAAVFAARGNLKARDEIAPPRGKRPHGARSAPS